MIKRPKLNLYISEIFKKIVVRPLIIPAVFLYVIFSIYLSFMPLNTLDSSVVKVEEITILQSNEKLSGNCEYIASLNGKRVLVKCAEKLYTGDVIAGDYYITFPHAATNPGQFDYTQYLSKKGISAIVNFENNYVIRRSRLGFHLTNLRYSLRNSVYSLVNSSLPDDDVALLSAFCLGDSSLITNDISRDFRVLNCSHVLAVSGSHFSSYLLVVTFLVKSLRISDRSKRIVVAIITVLLGFMTGWSESVTRSVIMSICILFSRDSLSGMSFAALVMIIVNPYVVLSDGFNMSFASCIGIKSLANTVDRIVSKFIKTKFIRDFFVISLCAQSGLLVFAYEKQTRYGLPQSIAQFLSGLLIEIICTMFLVGLIIAPISKLALIPSSYISRLLVALMHYMSRYFDFSVSFNDGGRYIPLIFTFVLLAFVLIKKHYVNNLLLIRLIAIITVISIFSYGLILLSKPKTRIIFLDVGQGDACLIITERFNCLIDTGTEDSGYQVITDALDYYSIGQLDMAIMTHWDEDHCGSVVKLYEQGRINKFYTSYNQLNDKISLLLSNHGVTDYEAFLETSDLLKEKQNVLLSDNDKLSVLWPRQALNGENEDSLVLLFQSYGYKILFTGDIDSICENILVDNGVLEQVEVLKVAHHGSKYSTSKEFLDVVNPDYAILSVGKYNNYGHPAKEVLDRLGEVEANIFDTSKNGAIIVKISKDGYELDSFKENRYGF